MDFTPGCSSAQGAKFASATPTTSQALVNSRLYFSLRGFSRGGVGVDEQVMRLSVCYRGRAGFEPGNSWEVWKDTSARFLASALSGDNGAENGASNSRKSSENGAVKPSQSYTETKTVRHSECNGGANSNRSGLLRTPLSGGVQSATSSHKLPSPAIAVRNLMEQARFAHLCTIMSRMHHRRRSYPFGSLVDFASDSAGHPIFALSPLATHTRNLLADPRCTLVVQIPGWSGLANARVTIFGDVYPLSSDHQALAHKYYHEKHQHAGSHQWGNYTFYRMENISDIYFVGGFGTVAWVDVKEYEKAEPDIIAVKGAELTLKELNINFSMPLKDLLSAQGDVDDVALISIDSKGVDIRLREGAQFIVQRISFEQAHAVETLEQANRALQEVLERAHACKPDVN